MRRKVVLRDEFGDQIAGIEHPARASDMPSTITVNGTTWWPEVWARHGWHITERGDWEQ